MGGLGDPLAYPFWTIATLFRVINDPLRHFATHTPLFLPHHTLWSHHKFQFTPFAPFEIILPQSTLFTPLCAINKKIKNTMNHPSTQDTDVAVVAPPPPPPDPYRWYRALTVEQITMGDVGDNWPVGNNNKPTATDAKKILVRCPALVKVMYNKYKSDGQTQSLHPFFKDAYQPCVLLNMASNKKSGGYIQLSYNGVNKFVTNAKLGALMRAIKTNTWDSYTSKERLQLQGSHRCANQLCICWRHIVLESATQNNQRKGCHGYVQSPTGDYAKVCQCGAAACLKVSQLSTEYEFSQYTLTQSQSTA